MHTHHEPELTGGGEAPDPIAAARALLAEDQRVRLEQCAAELQAVLDRYGMRLDVTPARVHLVPNP
jgi:hypothetical protein